jgi:hypothetical protein
MTNSVDSEPWRALPPEVADVIEPELEELAAEILATIPREVPEYARPFEGSFGRGIRVGVTEALQQFVALVRESDGGRERGREVYIELGRGELRQGRSLDVLQSAYRVGARVAWRRLGDAGLQAGLDQQTLNLLAEAIFAYIDELSADSVEGYAAAQSEREGERQRRRAELVTLLLRDPPADDADIAAAARAAGWAVPRSAAALATGEEALGATARRLPAEALATALDGVGCVIVPDPEGPGRSTELERAARDAPAALGPSAEPRDLASSWALARLALAEREAGRLRWDGLLRTEDHLGQLLVAANSPLLGRVASRRLAPLAGLTPGARVRM